MAYFAAVNDRGPAWDSSRPRRSQDRWSDHAVFIDALVAEGFVVLVGPVSPTRSLLILRAPDLETARKRLADDPWRSMGILRLVSLEPWEILIGRERLARAPG